MGGRRRDHHWIPLSSAAERAELPERHMLDVLILGLVRARPDGDLIMVDRRDLDRWLSKPQMRLDIRV